MKLNVILSNVDNTVGFLHIPDFKGAKARITMKYLKEVIKYLESFEDMGLGHVSEEITVGIMTEEDTHPGLILFFLDEKRKSAIAIVPLIKGEKDA